MTRYVQLSHALACQIGAGELGAGAELLSIRDLARREDTTISTVGRAYRHLGQAGVIEIGDRRRARVAARGADAARRLLATGATFRLAGSDDPALDLLLRHTGSGVVMVGVRGSLHGLLAVARGEADGAAIHLRHPSGDYNIEFARAALCGRTLVLVHLWRREQGLLLAPGNPHHITGLADLRGRRIAKRATGSGTRVLFDRLVTDAGLDPDTLTGLELESHLEVALTVAAGAADAGVAVRSAATGLGLGFLPLAWESYDLVLDRTALAAATPLLSGLRDHTVRAAITALGGYDLTTAGDMPNLTTPTTGAGPHAHTLGAADPAALLPSTSTAGGHSPISTKQPVS